MNVDGVAYTGDASLADGIDWQSEMNPGEKRTFSISYSAQGTAMFSYALALRQMQIRRLDVELSTGFADTVIPDGAMVPTRQDADGATTRVIWKGENLVTGQNIAMSSTSRATTGRSSRSLLLRRRWPFFSSWASLRL